MQTRVKSSKSLLETPLLQYATENVLWHNEVIPQENFSQPGFCAEFSQPLSRILLGAELLEYPSGLLNEHDLEFLRVIICADGEFRATDHKYYTSYLYQTLDFDAAWACNIWFQRLLPQVKTEEVASEIFNEGRGTIKLYHIHHDVFLWATELGLESVVVFYVQNLQIDVNRAGEANERDICLAAYNGDTKLVSFLLDHGADTYLPGACMTNTTVAAGSQNVSSFQAASMGGSAEVVELLLRLRQTDNLSSADFQDNSVPAASNGHLDVIDVLLLARLPLGVDINRPTSAALRAAVNAGHHMVAQKLVDPGADANFNPDTRVCNETLGLATKSKDVRMVKLLLTAGADINAAIVPYGTCVNLVVSFGHTELVKLLFERGADIHVQRERWGSALYIAALKGDKHMCDVLLHDGADVNQDGGLFRNCLQAAVVYGVEDIVRSFLRAGANVNAQGGHHKTALAAANSKPAIARLLSKAGAIPVGSQPGTAAGSVSK